MSYFDSLEELRQNLKTFKMEQESKLLDMAQVRTRETPLTQPVMTAKTGSKNDLVRFLDTEIIIAVASSSSGGRNKWPTALIASFQERVADLGFMESNGSLWKMIRKDGNYEGVRVILQTAEFGEKELFLTPDLELAQEQSKAAVWLLRLAAPQAVASSPVVAAAAAVAESSGTGHNVSSTFPLCFLLLACFLLD